jgi:hypothetical protein
VNTVVDARIDVAGDGRHWLTIRDHMAASEITEELPPEYVEMLPSIMDQVWAKLGKP